MRPEPWPGYARKWLLFFGSIECVSAGAFISAIAVQSVALGTAAFMALFANTLAAAVVWDADHKVGGRHG